MDVKIYPRHLNGREKRLVEAGLCDHDDAVWLALVALHSGVFTRRQWADWVCLDGSDTRRRVATMRKIAKFQEDGLVVSDENPGRGLGHVARVASKRIYRLLGIADSRLRRDVPDGTLLQRLLSLDFVLSCTDYPWLPTELEKMRVFGPGREGRGGLGIAKDLLPHRLYTGRDGSTTARWFVERMPIACRNKCARFVFVDDGSSSAIGALIRWGERHGKLWSELLDRGFDLEAVFASRTRAQLAAARRVMSKWSCEETGAQAELSAEQAAAAAQRIQNAFDAEDHDAIQDMGGVLAATQKLRELRGGGASGARGPVAVTRAYVWWSSRLARAYDAAVDGRDADGDVVANGDAAAGGSEPSSASGVESGTVPEPAGAGAA